MEELAQLRQLLVAGNTIEAIALVDELEEMSKKAIIRNIESYLVLLLAHLIKHQAEQRMTVGDARGQRSPSNQRVD